jgi:hypothetical protein
MNLFSLKSFAAVLAAFWCGYCGATDFPVFSVVGRERVLFSYDRDRCDDSDIPDNPLRAFRREDGKVVAFSTHYVNRRFIGASILEMKRDCREVFAGRHAEDPAQFNDRTWITSTLTADGRTILALGHNEYQADKFPGRCKFRTYSACWYNAIVPLSSSDGGQSFSRVDEEEALPIAAPPFKSEENEGKPRGYFNPTNFVSYQGAFYVLISQSGFNGVNSGPCLFRLDKVSGGTWDVFDGNGFVRSSGNPYTDLQPPRSCAPVQSLTGAVGSIAQIDGTDIFAAFSIVNDAVDVYYSRDLFHWSDPSKLMDVVPYWSQGCAAEYKYNYASVLDPTSKDRNFGTLARSPYLFLVRMKCSASGDRDLVVLQLKISSG